MKKWVFCLFALLLVSIFCIYEAVAEELVQSSEPEIHTIGDYEYIILEDNTAEIVYYLGSDEELIVPEKLDGYCVTRISDSAFYDPFAMYAAIITGFDHKARTEWCSSVTSITIPDSVTNIEANLFRDCPGLKNIIISADHPCLSVTDGVLFNISEHRLIYYPRILPADSYTIPDGIQIIAESAFYSCDLLASITIPDSVTSIENDAFSKCSSLASVTIPSSVTSIGNGAFSGCSSLASITIPDSVTTLGDDAFSRCSSLTSVTIPSSVTSIVSTFKDCESLASVTIPSSVTSIGGSAFSGCSSLASITIPDSVTSIGKAAFSGCSSLASVTIPDSVTSIGDGAFNNCKSLISITIPDSVTGIGKTAFRRCPSLTITVNRGSYAAQYCEENRISYTYAD